MLRTIYNILKGIIKLVIKSTLFILQIFVDLLKRQWIDYSNVKPMHRCDNPYIYLVSEAGMIRYKYKSLKDLTKFRDKYLNKFEALICEPETKRIFSLFRMIRSEFRVSYRANIRTRLKGF